MLFVSYSTRDTERVNQICDALRQHGIDYWIYPERRTYEENWPAQIESALYQCTTFLVIISNNVCDRPSQVGNELALANGRQDWGMSIFALLLDGQAAIPEHEGFNYVLNGKQWCDLSAYDPDEFERFLTDILDKERQTTLHNDVVEAHDLLGTIDQSSADFIAFSNRAMRMLYSDGIHDLVQYHGQTFPDVILPASDEVRSFDYKTGMPAIQDHCTLDVTLRRKERDPREDLSLRVTNAYAKVPVNYVAYMNREITLDEQGCIRSIGMFPGTRRQNVMTTSTLRTEFALAYAELRQRDHLDSFDREELLELYPIRRQTLEACGDGLASLLKGAAGYSEFGVQTLVLMRIRPTIAHGKLRRFRRYAGEYFTPLVERGTNLEEQPGFYQFAPCGAFSVFESTNVEPSERLVRDDFDLFLALMYHYCDELFSDFGDVHGPNEPHDPTTPLLRGGDALENNAHFLDVVYMLEDGRARIEFLGIESSLTMLKSDLVFALVIDDEDYFDRNRESFRANSETSELVFYPIRYVDSPKFMRDKTAAWELAGHLDLLRRGTITADAFGK